MTRMRWLSLLLVLLSLSSASRAHAHAIGLSRGDYALEGSTLSASLTFARSDVLALVPTLDSRGDGTLAESEVTRGGDALARGIVDRLSVHAAGAPCAPRLESARLTDGDGLTLHASYVCPAAAPEASVAFDALFDELPSGHRHLAHLASSDREQVLFHGSSARTVAEGSSPSSAPAGSPSSHAGAGAIFRMGVEHILTGYDHLLFLFGLVLVARRMRTLLPVVTAFTVAHSLTLGVAVLGWWTPPSRIVEPLIALSIAYVGFENLFMTDAGKRWRITFPFGLIHGFGFASALRELALPHHEVPLALVSFNLGVEAGQLAVILVMLPLVALLRRLPWLEGARARIPSLGVAAVGAVWFIARVV